ncbi:acyl-CoA dehydrogenase family protein [Iamia sp.]|uniref:acyl-CoA dehydrogenase family protein n=1 Tax=Iamia sp. TaxID=2722710 RepID=UPI002CAF6336|nr:acyl-CoA dehydrogenase family protein [Iamia sp.]HXH59705.1 acyl-CoA dehydrogenase family protein [Iamia sp.]
MTDVATRTADPATDPDEARVREAALRLVADHPPEKTSPEEFLGAQFDAGLAWISFREGHGGLGVAPRLAKVVQEVLRGTGAPNAVARNPIGHGMGAPTVYTHGSDAQRERYLRPLFTGEEVWCQMFSEPGAGSDVASLSTRAVLDGEEWIVNGQKVWTTVAHLSRWGMLVARTDPDQPKHKGLTYFVVDMHAPGVEVRPLFQITGEAEFNEVYFTDVRIPDAERLGEVGEGWRVSITTLMNERVSIGGGIAARGTGMIEIAVRAWIEAGRPGGAARDELMKLWARSEVLRLTNWRASQNRAVGTPGPEGSIGKSAGALLNQAITTYAVGVTGAGGMLLPDGGYPMARPRRMAMDVSSTQKAFLRCRANTIEGGTTEIMKNILAERVLGLPGDVRVDKERPWTDVPR